MPITHNLKNEGNELAGQVIDEWLGHWFGDYTIFDNGKTIAVTEAQVTDLQDRFADHCILDAVSRLRLGN